MRFKKIRSITMTTGHLSECLAFYRDTLDLSIRTEGDLYLIGNGKRDLLKIRELPVAYMPSAKCSDEAGSQNYCFRAQGRIGELFQRLRDHNARLITGEIEDQTGALGVMKSIYMFDPDGCLTEVAVYRDTDEPYRVTDLDHVVIIADNVYETMEFYRNVLGIDGDLTKADSVWDVHGFLYGEDQKINVHHKEPKYEPHKPYAAIGSVHFEWELPISFEELKERLNKTDPEVVAEDAKKRRIIFYDPNGNLLDTYCSL